MARVKKCSKFKYTTKSGEMMIRYLYGAHVEKCLNHDVILGTTYNGEDICDHVDGEIRWFPELRSEVIGKEEYKKYLASDEWKRRREIVLKRENYQCQICDSDLKLNIHHTHYLDRDETVQLACLCQKCHEDISNFIPELWENAKDLKDDELIGVVNELFDDYFYRRAKEFNSKGDVWFIRKDGAGRGRINKYIHGLIEYYPYEKLQESAVILYEHLMGFKRWGDPLYQTTRRYNIYLTKYKKLKNRKTF